MLQYGSELVAGTTFRLQYVIKDVRMSPRRLPTRQQNLADFGSTIVLKSLLDGLKTDPKALPKATAKRKRFRNRL